MNAAETFALASDRLDAATPLVSVIVPAHNAAATLGRALQSVAVQDWAPLEVIVVDDASSDNIAPIVDAFPQLRVRLVSLEKQQGVSVARNRGLEFATGEFVAFLDADDEWLPGKLRRQVNILRATPSAAMSCTEVLLCENGRTDVYSTLMQARAHGKDAWKALLRTPCVVTSSVMTRRKLLCEVGGFDPDLLIGEDQDLWIRLSLRGEAHHETTPLTRKYQMPGGLSSVHRNLVATVALPMIERHVSALADRLSERERRDILTFRRLVAGRNSYESGDIVRGARLILLAILKGDQPLLPNLLYLIVASPVARYLRRSLSRSGGTASAHRFREAP